MNESIGKKMPYEGISQAGRKRVVKFKGGSRHDRNRHNRRNRPNRRNRHGRLIVLHFVGQAKGGQGALQHRQDRQTAQTVMKATPLKLNPLVPSSWSKFLHDVLSSPPSGCQSIPACCRSSILSQDKDAGELIAA